MAADDDIWKRLAASGLVNGAQVASIRTEFEHDPAPRSSTASQDEAVLQWLAKDNRISPYQRAVLASGASGPFQFDDYVVYGRTETGPLTGTFRARHVPTGHPVRLFFCGGDTIETAHVWHRARRLAEAWQTVHHPLVWQIFEWVASAHYRFVVTTAGNGKTMQEKVPRKGRLPWPQAAQAMEQLAHGLQAIDRCGLIHGNLSPDSIWIQKSGVCQIMPPLPLAAMCEQAAGESGSDRWRHADHNAGAASQPFLSPVSGHPASETPSIRQDLFALGQVGVRLIAGRSLSLRPADYSGRLQDLEKLQPIWEKYRVPDPLQALITGLLTADVSEKPPSTQTVVRMLKNILGNQSTIDDADSDPPTLAAYRDALAQRHRSAQFFEALESRADGNTAKPFPAASAEQTALDVASTPDFASIQSGQSLISASQRVTRRRDASRRRSRIPWLVFPAILVAASAGGVVLSRLGQPDASSGTGGPDRPVSTAGVAADGDRTDGDLADRDLRDGPGVVETAPSGPGPEGKRDTALPVASSNWLQQTVAGDSESLAWVSPTAGPPIDAYWLPPAPEFILTWRPAHVLDSQDAPILIRALGPGLQRLLDRWQALTGVSLQQIRRMTVSLHAAEGRYDVLVNAELVSAMDRQVLLEGMPNAQESSQPVPGTRVYETDSFKTALVTAAPGAGQVERILLGTGDTISNMFTAGGLAACDRNLARLIERSDRDRDWNVLFLNSALLSEEATRLFSGDAARLRRPLHLFFDEQVRAVLFSGHSDRGDYLELMTEQTIDLPAEESATELQQRMHQARDQLTRYVADRPAHPYWRSLQQRMVAMLTAVVDNTRITTEADGVIANCWLPPSALHNLVAVTELSLADARFDRGPPGLPGGPQTLPDLLAASRSLELTNSPDLRVLLEDLQSEIRDDFPELPFEFRIRLMGDDLRLDGITQNQRPGDILITQKPLADILTTIMFQANPDKDATGPADPRCKLVWVMTADPDQPDRQIIQVTTRAAAAARNLELPAAFREP